MMTKLPKYRENLFVTERYVYSYNTESAVIDHEKREIRPYRFFSVTTSRHVNYVAKYYGYTVVK